MKKYEILSLDVVITLLIDTVVGQVHTLVSYVAHRLLVLYGGKPIQTEINKNQV